MGIYPAGAARTTTSFIPATLAEAGEFYASYVRAQQQHAGPESLRRRAHPGQPEDDEGSDSVGSNGCSALGYAPRICMTELMTPEELARVGVTPLMGHKLLKLFLSAVLRWARTSVSTRILRRGWPACCCRGWSRSDRRGQVSFSVPFTRLDVRGPAFE